MSAAVHVLHIEHRVADFEAWKRNAFDADPIGRARMRVRGHRVARAAEDRNLVAIDLEFDSRGDADAMLAALRELWANPRVPIEPPSARVLEVVDEVSDHPRGPDTRHPWASAR